MFQQFMKTHSTFVEKTEAQFKQYDSQFRNQEASIKNIENQLGQISHQLTQRPQGTLPSNTIKNPRGDVKAITLRSGKELMVPEKKMNKEGCGEIESLVKKYELPMRRNQSKEEESVYVPPQTYDPPLPYPQRVQQQRKEQ
ncbi:hypothetical protein PIB30_096085 [Stylosanthes scabra]|uniref:Reverse transcriptase domain-containing protein n=1 Tax=Stylosanthes scabra TaxID=79078 RepID=A0ABU6RXB1_9FABA|nr:hypothetical protein [Stylosanthes scabra]